MSVLKSISYIVRSTRRQILTQYRWQLEVYRGLYSASSLGLDGFLENQQRVKSQLMNIQDKFRTKMRENVEDDSKNVIFTEDLKNMLHLAENDDLDTVMKMMKKFNKQNKELRFGNFVFGPVIMRMFYTLGKPEEALQCFKSPDFAGLLDQLITYQLLCDLLYENKRYQDILDCFAIIKERQIEGAKYPRNIIVLVLAACYKMNTADSLKYAIDLWIELSKVGHLPARRASTFFAGLLINHGKPDLTLEVLSNMKNQNYTTVRNLKLLALMQLNRLEDTIPIMKSILSLEQINTFNKDVLDTVKKEIDKSNNTELQSEFEHIMKIFRDQNHISNTTLDEQLTGEISSYRHFNRNQDNPRQFQSGRFWRPRQDNRRNERVALRDLE